MPPRESDDRGRVRRVGVEIEFAGVSVAESVALLIHLYGGSSEPINRYSERVFDTRLGEFRVEIDATILTSERYKELLEKLGVSAEGRVHVEDALEVIAAKFVPCEIACPPIAIADLGQLDALREALLEHGALGTRASLLYAFGLQLNPEVPARDARTLRDHLAAFLLLYDWIVEISKIDVTRKLAPFIDPFPEEYRQHVLAPGYHPNLDQLIDDYLEHNPTRNRPLDMLPMFVMLREERVRAIAKDQEKIKARPTFHYRLPNCLIDEPQWSFSTEWNRWVEVERLAADPKRLRALSDSYLQLANGVFGFRRKRWVEEVAELIPGEHAA